MRERFLIGSGGGCDLRLGGSEIPALHSIIYHDDAGTWLDALVSEPALRVNGRQEQCVAIHVGDHIEIGRFDFVVKPSDSAPEGLELMENDGVDAYESVHPQRPGEALSGAVTLEELTACELVELIEREQAEVDKFEATRRMGAQTMLSEVLSRAAAKRQHFAEAPRRDVAVAPPTLEPLPASLLMDIEQVLTDINGVALELRQRSERLREREATCTEAAASLLEAQRRLAQQLETFVKQVGRLRSKASDSARRVA